MEELEKKREQGEEKRRKMIVDIASFLHQWVKKKSKGRVLELQLF